jgi:TRAP-type mannitol/chloroaromatic compound transport system permease large subunit
MTEPQVALLMLGLFIFVVFLGFPIAFTLMAMGHFLRLLRLLGRGADVARL